ncbi:helix-turn-helix domain-containing protein [Streptomyces griseomycini]|uniref:helix-turn-helix domain-containing protein n=1 Tax=Streptomyces griseomycini TaxID=66895 RepID=UPI0035CA142A
MGGHLPWRPVRAAWARRFTAPAGRPPLAHPAWLRGTATGRLLRSGDTPLRVVAERLGRPSEFAFAKAFRREYGIPPGRYRRRPASPLRPRRDPPDSPGALLPQLTRVVRRPRARTSGSRGRTAGSPRRAGSSGHGEPLADGREIVAGVKASLRPLRSADAADGAPALPGHRRPCPGSAGAAMLGWCRGNGNGNVRSRTRGCVLPPAPLRTGAGGKWSSRPRTSRNGMPTSAACARGVSESTGR